VIWGALALLVAFAPSAHAQTVTDRVAWDQPGATLADLPLLVYTLKVDALPPIILVPTCTFTTVLSCTAPITLTPAPHTLTLTVSNGFGSASSAPLTGATPLPGVNVKVIITVTVP
jgi:hypothetical protein